jgi:hypothetical protein
MSAAPQNASGQMPDTNTLPVRLKPGHWPAKRAGSDITTRLHPPETVFSFGRCASFACISFNACLARRWLILFMGSSTSFSP